MLLFMRTNWHICISAVVIEHAPLEAVYVFFDTATYDEIQRDVKVTTFQDTLITTWMIGWHFVIEIQFNTKSHDRNWNM